MVKVLSILLGVTSVLLAAGPDFDRALKLYDRTDFEQSLQVLQAIPAKDAAVYALMGRNYYMQGEYKKATELLDKAFAAEPGNADYALWLGRSLGPPRRNIQPFTAPGQASKARQYFEKSVQLNPNNLEALERPLRILPGGARLAGRRTG